ncbi:hypothetical protein [Pontibacter rugosus]|uniref:Uncharacterized protein n=1 Tax=Pontibacter rugosus TaxID=1745966 RepID=A0ABW3SIJ1_9BACT
MSKTWGNMRDFLLMATFVLLCMLIMPVAQAHANGAPANTTTVTAPQTSPKAADSEQKAPKSKAKVVTKPRDKSVLDAEVLESPLSYFRNAFNSDEDETDASRSGAVMITVKALVATLLSTVI